MIEKNYQPADIETRMSRIWEESGAFRAGRPERRDAKPFTIVIPPPNVTGSLHMGHALNNTLQDILCRFERMRGRDVLWQPGTDHAGIATQMVVERQLMERQEPGRREMGRAKFLERVWQWKAESGGVIVNQLKRLGASCDWSRERFTMDEGLSRAVVKVFVELHREGLIYKDKRLVNWDPKLLTAISDLEVQQIEVKGHLWYLRYPLEGKAFNPEDPSSFIVVATTRPETMLGDSGVAVHPDDERYANLVGTHVILPLVGRRIPIVADEYSDPAKGSGAVKVTPAHDFNDFEVGNRHGLPRISVLDQEGRIALADNEDYLRGLPEGSVHLAEELNGLDRFAARKLIVARLEDFGFLEKIEPNTHMVPHGDRSGVVIEPYLTDQWYVDAHTMAQPAIAAVRGGATSFVPKNWEKTYFEWMENIQPWCISRQLWWGHQIPAWYGPDGKVFVAETEEEAVSNALGYYAEQEVITPEQGREMALDPAKRADFIKRDEDVLDTWFSSALWPFSTLGWPDDDTDVKRYYPTNVLVTGWDIIFFWVARMMMMGLHFMKEAPFSTVYIHRLVRDEKGAKMSKSKGNVIDPLGVIDEYGADALRFALAREAAHSHDIKLSPQLVETNRNFATKLWNACRFAEMNDCVLPPNFDPVQAKQTLNRWIAHETTRATREVTEAIEAFRFNDAANAIYRFVWNVYCDWYLELAKPGLMGEDGAAKSETRAMVAWARDEILKLLHPFMPFITEELWAVTAKRDGLLVLAPWSRKAGALTPEQVALMTAPSVNEPFVPPSLFAADTVDFSDPAAEAEIGWVVDLVTAIRSVRAEMNITPATLTPLVLAAASAETRERAQRWNDVVKRMARLADISFADRAPEGAVQLLVRGEVAALPLKGVIDLSAEKARLDKELAKAEADIKRVDAKLGNEKFVANAPEEIVEEEKEKREAAVARKAKFVEALERLKHAEVTNPLDRLENAASDLRVEMEQLGRQIRELVLAQPPYDLLGYLWSKFAMAALFRQEDKSEPDKDTINRFQFVLEYVHAAWSSYSTEFSKGNLDEAKVGELLSACDALRSKAMFYAMTSGKEGSSTELGEASPYVEFQAKSAWVLIRGHRYQVLEEEFFRFVLRPHETALKEAYGVGAVAIAEGIQSITHSIRGGYGAALEKMRDRMEASQAIRQNEGVSLKVAIEKIKEDDPAFSTEMAGVWDDLFRGGICNLSRHTQLPTALLDDLSYVPGAEQEFFAAGEYCGTPYRTLPARVRPVVRLSEGYYATDGQFVRDSAYRAIQRGVIARQPDYREGWNKNQKEVIERAFPEILSAQLRDATSYEGVYFKDPATGEWAETDLVGIVDDTLFVVEAKAGVMAMHSPATDFDRHIRTIRELVLKAYKQCRRFLEYLSTGDQMPVFRLKDGKYEELARLSLKSFRRVVPIGLTVEAFTPFSAMCKEIPEVAPILGVHPFVSMSVDDLFVLNRFLPTTGELFHYLEVRQAVAGLPKAMMFDEIDHLGAYVKRNRFDQDIEEQLKTADMVAWDSFSDVVDQHFMKEDWQTSPVPHQEYPAELSELLDALGRSRPKGWLAIDAYVRNFGGDARDKLATVLRDLKPTLKDHPVRRFLFGNEKPVQLWLSRNRNKPTSAEIQRHAEIACLTVRVPSVPVVVIDCNQDGKFETVSCSIIDAPPNIRLDYSELAAEAERQRQRLVSLGDPNESNSNKR